VRTITAWGRATFFAAVFFTAVFFTAFFVAIRSSFWHSVPVFLVLVLVVALILLLLLVPTLWRVEWKFRKPAIAH